MPLKVQKGKGKFKVVSKKTGKVVQETKSFQKAKATAKASYSRKGPLAKADKERGMY